MVALIIFRSTPLSGDELNNLIKKGQIEISTIQYLYLGVTALFLAAAALFYFSKSLPKEKVVSSFESKQSHAFTIINFNNNKCMFCYGICLTVPQILLFLMKTQKKRG